MITKTMTKYDALERLTSGSFSYTYKSAYQDEISGERKFVVIKVISLNCLHFAITNKHETFKKLKREVDLLKTIKDFHHVVKFVSEVKLEQINFDFISNEMKPFTSDEMICFATEYIVGDSLYIFFKNCKDNWLEFGIRLIFQIGYVLVNCHGEGIAHRDLHPNNVIISKNSNQIDVNIIDFGFSTQIAPQQSSDSYVHQGSFPKLPRLIDSGTPTQKELKDWISGDLYCLAAILLWWLTNGDLLQRYLEKHYHLDRNDCELSSYYQEDTNNRPYLLKEKIGDDDYRNLNNIILKALNDEAIETVEKWLDALRKIEYFRQLDPGDPETPSIVLSNGVNKIKTVKLDEKTFVSKTVVTQSQWNALMGTALDVNDFQFKNASFVDAQRFIDKVNELLSNQKRQYKCRLPSKKEIEKIIDLSSTNLSTSPKNQQTVSDNDIYPLCCVDKYLELDVKERPYPYYFDKSSKAEKFYQICPAFNRHTRRWEKNVTIYTSFYLVAYKV